MAERVVFDAAWLYGPDGRMEMVTDAARYRDLCAEGWKDTPAAFGIETHPQRAQQEVVQTVFGPMSSAVPSPAEAQRLQLVEETTVSLQETVSGVQDILSQMADTLSAVQRELLAANDANQKLHARLTAVEQALTTPETDEPHSGRGRRT